MKNNLVTAALAVSLSWSAVSAVSANTKPEVNYGDPTASYKGLGLQTDGKQAQLSGVYGSGEHIGSFDLGTDFNGGYNYRGRYFNVDQQSGFGWSVDVLGGNDHTATLGGLVQKYQLTDNVILVPMLAVGRVFTDAQDSNVVQPGLYALYAFEQGHWLYANPKSTYIRSEKTWTSELEIGGGYLVDNSSSVGFKVDHKRVRGTSDTTAWINYFRYF